MSSKGNFQNLFLSKSVKRSSGSQEKATIVKPKPAPASGKLSSNGTKYKPLNFMFSASSFERKPIFRITSISQNLVANTKSAEREEPEEEIRRLLLQRKNKQGMLQV